MKIIGNRKDDLLEDALSDPFFSNIGNKGVDNKLPRSVNDNSSLLPKRYHGLEIEPGYSSRTMTWDSSLRRLRELGMNHMCPMVYMDLCIDSCNKTLDPELDKIVQDIHKSGRLWLNPVWERKGDRLFWYFFAQGIEWDSEKCTYDFSNLSCADHEEYNVTGIPSRTCVPLCDFPENFIKELTGRKYDELPELMKEGYYQVKVMLPPDGVASPLGVGHAHEMFTFKGYGICNACSRGVKHVK
ncbi:hypothetical protein KY330_04330 [Candidatus Woesearchaeota archaeon]|nr:hypothetical protein [Candidatus Woesearchaeota archaeon]